MQLENIVRYTQLKIGKKILSQIFLDIVNTLKYCEIEFLLWSRRQGSNLRPHGPKPRALPTALRLD